MHAYILIIWAFLAPTQDNPHVTMKASLAVTQSAAECEALGEATASQVAQMKGVNSVHYVCTSQISDEAEKPV